MGRQHVLQQQAVQVFSGLDLILLRAVLVLQQEVLAGAGLVLADTHTHTQKIKVDDVVGGIKQQTLSGN